MSRILPPTPSTSHTHTPIPASAQPERQRGAVAVGWPTAVDREALRLARQLTPAQRHLLVRAGLPRWMRLTTAWHPEPGREAAAARELGSRPFGLLEPLPHDRRAYQLTHLGELVAGIALLNVLTLS